MMVRIPLPPTDPNATYYSWALPIGILIWTAITVPLTFWPDKLWLWLLMLISSPILYLTCVYQENRIFRESVTRLLPPPARLLPLPTDPDETYYSRYRKGMR